MAISETEIRVRMNAEIDLHGLNGEREKSARFAVGILVPVVKRLIQEEIREFKKSQQ